MSERKPDDQRINRNPRLFPSTILMWDGKTRGPEIPDGEWAPESLSWWEFVRNSAQAMLMQDSDWEQLKIALKLYNQMYVMKKTVNKRGDVVEVPCTPGELRALAAEFRTYTETYGFTRQSRVRYGISIVDPSDAETEASQALLQAAQSPPSVDYRKLLGGKS